MEKKLLVIAIMAIMIIFAGRDAKAFELELEGTTGYGVIDLTFRSDDSNQSKNQGTVPAGAAFTILSEGSKYFNVEYQGQTGWVYKDYTMVNLPDLIPSIIYDATNSYDSQYTSCGADISKVTHQALYTGKTWNAKLGYEEYNMPVLYNMAKKIAGVQASMLADNRSLILYEGFRPLEVQKRVNDELSSLMTVNATVKKAICNSGWSKSWFIASSVSNHQKGYAVDVGMAAVTEFESKTIDGREIACAKAYTGELMPTKIHELSPAAASLAYGVSSKSKTAWQSVPNAKTMTQSALELRDYFVNAGMSPLASEWWHFNDIDAMNASNGRGTGNFEITGNVSR